MKLSIIIPCLNEAEHIQKCIGRLQQASPAAEIIVVDGGSQDNTCQLAQDCGVLLLSTDRKSRAIQMNMGAAAAKNEVLYFVHADALPPTSCHQDIKETLGKGYNIGRFRFLFDSPKPMLKINSWFTRFDKPWVSGGDETLFITKPLFESLGGYDCHFTIMEEYDLVRRARITERYKIIQKDVLVSPRKYDGNSWLQVQRANLKAFQLFKEGAEPETIKQAYYKMIKHPKA